MSEILNKNEYVYKSNYIYTIVSAYRPGAALFMTKLEHDHFPPHDPELNDLYTVHFMKHDNQPYIIVGVPMEYLQQCKKLAEDNNLRLVNGTPNLFREKKETDTIEIDRIPFPIHHSPDLTYTLENCKSYETPQQLQIALQFERKIIKRYLQSYYATHPE